MHSIKYANRVRNRYLVLDDPELEKATDAWVTLTEKLGDDEADRWFDEHITDTDAWPEITQKIGAKLDELARTTPGTIYNLDWDSIEPQPTWKG